MPHRISALTRVLNPLRLTRYARSSTLLDFETPVPGTAAEHHRHGLLGFLRLGRRQLTVGAAVVVAGFFGVSALPAVAAPSAPEAAAQHLQSMSVNVPVTPTVARDAYAITHFTPVSWPIPASITMTSDYGPRRAPCRGCSSFHEGIDWTPGAGYPVAAIADGVVVEAQQGGGLGVHVFIQHNIDGDIVTSGYAHMQRGSMGLRVGDVVARGQIIGRVGNTGASTGAHLHFILEHGSATFDPWSWLQAHVNS